jgi:hypothetical protein
MSLAALFVVGLIVTLIVGAAIALLIYAAVLDGRRQRELTEADAVRVIDRDAVFGDPATDSGTDPEPLRAA